MPVLTPFDLSFRGGLHLGTRGVNMEEAGVSLPSDTLFAAMLDAWRRTGGAPEAFVAPFAAEPPDPPLLLSSAFPFAGTVRFFPMPVDAARLFSAGPLRNRGKAIRRIRYLSEHLLRLALSGQRLDEWLFPEDEYKEPATGVALQGGALWLTLEEITQLPKQMRREKGQVHALRHLKVTASSRVPRVTVDRINSASTIFHVGRTAFAPGCGLWFGVQWQRADATVAGMEVSYRDAVAQSLGLLSDDGLGGERSTGYGSFAFRPGDALDLPAPLPGQPALLLSRYHPRPTELPVSLADPRSAYSLTAVAGWLRSPDGAAQRRKQLHLVQEGSIICPPGYPAGDVANVKPDYDETAGELPHDVYRYGLALAVDASKLPEADHA